MTREQTVYKGKLLHVVRRVQRLPNGRETVIESIRHPGAALMVPVLPDGRVILLRQYRPVLRGYLYEFPAGTRNGRETPLSCARREIEEETGYRAGRFTKLGVIHPVPGYSTEQITLYRADGLVRTRTRMDADEIIESRPLTRAQIRSLVSRGLIRDAKSLCALALMGWMPESPPAGTGR